MLGNAFMSDITIYSKEEREIPVHSLVLFVQCPNILDDVIVEELNTSERKKMIMWLDYSYEACFSFLELIYSGQESCISPEYRNEYLCLGTRYNIFMAVNDNDKLGWFATDKITKRKSPDVSNSPADYKRYKASSPDMFLLDEIREKNGDSNFLGANVNDEKSFSVLKTKQWLDKCNSSQQNHNSSFTENLAIDVSSSPTSIPEKSPSHSFHSASTKNLLLSPISNYNGDIMCHDNHDTISNLPLDKNNYTLPKLPSTDKLNVQTTLMEQKINKFKSNISVNYLTKDSTLTNTHTEPELIIIDSEDESMDIIFSNYKKNPYLRINNLLNKNDYSYLSQSSSIKHNSLSNSDNIKQTNCSTIIQIDDSSSDSNHSISSCRLYSKNKSSPHSLFKCPKAAIIDHSVSSEIVKLFPMNNVNTNSNVDIVDLVDTSSDFLSEGTIINNKSISIQNSLNNVQESYKNSSLFSSLTGYDKSCALKSSSNCDMNSLNYLSNTNLFSGENNSKSIKQNNVTNIQIDAAKNNYDEHNSNFETNLMATTYIPQSTIKNKTESLFPSNNSTLKKVCVSIDPIEQFDSINTSKLITLNTDNFEQDISVSEQMIDNPWMDYLQPINKSSQYVSSDLSESVSVDASNVQTPVKHKQPVDSNLQTPIISKYYSKTNSGTPDKYGSRIHTPNSLRRVQSESAIICTEQVTPLPDYSSMKTPDLRVNIVQYIIFCSYF